MIKRARFRGHIDSISEGCVRGWLINTKHPTRSVIFDLFINGAYRGQWTCAHFRPDLLEGGMGSGIHGFKLSLPDVTSDDQGSIEMFVAGGGAIWLAVVDGQLREQKGVGLTRAARLKRFRDRLVKSGNGECPKAVLPNASWVSGVLARDHVYGNERRSLIKSSDFTEFLRRLKDWKEDDERFYCWYVNDYVYRLDSRFIPLSDEEKAFVKSLVERTRQELRLPPLTAFLRVTFLKNFSVLRQAYEVYWWRAEGGRSLKLDEAIPTNSEQLEETVRVGLGNSFPLNIFMILFASRTGLVNPLLMLFPFGRRRVYEWCFYYSRSNPHIHKYVNDLVERHLHSSSATSSYGHNESSFSKTRATSGKYRLQFIGPFDKLLGLGESSRRLMDAVRVVEPSCNFVCYNDGIQSASMEGEYSNQTSCADINIIHLNSEQIPEFLLKIGDELKESYNILFPYWELNKISSLHRLGISLVDEVWTASTFIGSLFRLGDLPVVTTGLPAQKLGKISEQDGSRGAEGFTFLTSFDAFSWPQRKNAIAVVEGFIAAFQGHSDVRLIIKTQNADHVHSPNQRKAWLEIRQRSSHDPRIVIINETYTPDRQRELLCSCDCFVSLHRSEGLGIDILDALASGIPVIATSYSGNMDVCSERNTWLVDYDLIPLQPCDYVFVEDGHFWADPIHSSAVSAMRGVYSEHSFRVRKSVAGVIDAENLRSVASVAERVSERLRAIRASRSIH